MEFAAQSTAQKRLMVKQNITRAKGLINDAQRTIDLWQKYVVEQQQRLADLEQGADP